MKTIPVALQAHKDAQDTTLCYLLKITTRDGDVYGLTTLDEDLTYDDGQPSGAISYLSINNYTVSSLSAKAGTSVDNADITFIVAALEAQGLTENQVRSGKLDFGDLWLYQVNYESLSDGHEIVHRGKFGQVSSSDETARAEFRSLTQILKQGITRVTSLTCRARFGSQVGEEQYPCTKVRTWISATITAVDPVQPDAVFTCSSLAQASGYFVPGIVRILTGLNAGVVMELSAFAAGVVELALPQYNTFTVGDTLEISQDCNKRFDDAVHGCLYHHGADRSLWFRGEPLIPIGREGEISTPGADQ